MNIETITTAEFAARFPNARSHQDAVRYIVVQLNPKKERSPEIELADGEKLVQVGYTNASGTKRTERYAIVQEKTSMTLHEVAEAIASSVDEYGEKVHFINDWAGRYNISNEEAERIASRSGNLAQFEKIWENQDWWTDDNN